MDTVCGLFLAVLALAGVLVVGFLIVTLLSKSSDDEALDHAARHVIHAPGQAARQAMDDLERAYVYEELQRAMDSDEKYTDMLRSVDEQLRRQA